MIDWLIQTCDHHPELAQGNIPPGLLHPAEQARLASLKTGKRRRDWLLGRWTAKHLVQAYIETATGAHMPLNALAVVNDPRGVPMIEYAAPQDSRLRLSLCLSISHCDGRAFCAVCPGEDAETQAALRGLGADIERIEDRSPSFAQDYFTPDEMQAVMASPNPNTTVTALWSLKEAVLKALQRGLTVDTRRISCRLERLAGSDDWQPAAVHCSPGLLQDRSIRAWWRTWENYVLSLAVITDHS